MDPAIVVSISLWVTCFVRDLRCLACHLHVLTPTAAHLCSATNHDPDILLRSNQSAPLLLLPLLLFRARHVRWL